MERPVTVPPGAETDTELLTAIQNLAGGNRPFGLTGLFGKAEQKNKLNAIRVGIATPVQPEEWNHVANYLLHLNQLRELALRWNTLAQELPMEAVPGTKPEDGLSAAKLFTAYLTLKKIVAVETNLCSAAESLFPSWPYSREVGESPERLAELERALHHHLKKNRLATIWATKENFQKVLEGRFGRVIDEIRDFFSRTLGDPSISDAEMQGAWSALMGELARVRGFDGYLETVRGVCDRVKASGAPHYAESLKAPVGGTADTLLPDNWRLAWRLKRLANYLDSIDARDEMKKLAKDRHDVENDLSRAYRHVVVKRTWLKLAGNASPKVRAALQAYLAAIQKIGKGTGKRAVRFRQDAREATSQANPAVPCWIMPHYRVSESLPPELGCFDLVVIDEASQSDLTALPALLRAQKVLIVGDEKQVSPDVVGLQVAKVNNLMNRFLGNQVPIFRAQMDPAHSIYDLFKVAFATSTVMLKEHFRCVGPIIEYSKREFYNHELRPLRLPRASERIDPPLVDVLIEDGYRKGDVNLPEARFIVEEIKRIVEDLPMRHRSIGVVSLLADKQALEI